MPETEPARRRELTTVHASIAPVDAVLDARRTLYQLALDLLRPDLGSVPQPWEVLDSPSVRGRIGKALASGDATLCDELVPLDTVVGHRWLSAGSTSIPVASRPGINRMLADAVGSVGAELARQTGKSPSLRLLTEADGDRFSMAFDQVAEGLRIVWSVSPRLAADLLRHVALVGIVDPECTDALASASSRDYPGLVLLSPPGSAIEAAEWLVHESAHQKLFDLAVTGFMLTAESDTCQPYSPPWPPAGRQWPLEQALAAAHAYACMAQFADDAGDLAALGVESGSLLPVARGRTELICGWLLGRGNYLGRDAHALLAGICGQRPTAGPATLQQVRFADCVGIGDAMGPEFLVRRCVHSDRTLIGLRSQPPELLFVVGPT